MTRCIGDATGRTLRAAVLLVLVAACESDPPVERAPTTDTVPPPAQSLPSWIPLDSLPLLAASAVEQWRLTPLAHAPAHVRVIEWKDSVTVWGTAGCNPIELRTDVPEFSAWGVDACGGIAPAPDGQRLAWSEGRGGIWLGERGGAPELLLAPGTRSPAGEGDPTGSIRWSVDGRRVLTSWALEWTSHFASIDVATRALLPLATSMEGYYLVEAWDWLDQTRILFTAQATRDLQGRSEYSESGGVRADLALANLTDSTLVRVTSVPDSVMLKPLGRWTEEEVLVGERSRAASLHQRYWAYDSSDWSRRPIALPAASDVVVFDTTRVLALRREGGAGGGARTRVFLWRGSQLPPEPLIELRDGAVAWSPEGRRLAFSTSADEPVAGMPGSFRTRSYAYVLELR
jgi:hypothetical protein